MGRVVWQLVAGCCGGVHSVLQHTSDMRDFAIAGYGWGDAQGKDSGLAMSWWPCSFLCFHILMFMTSHRLVLVVLVHVMMFSGGLCACVMANTAIIHAPCVPVVMPNSHSSRGSGRLPCLVVCVVEAINVNSVFFFLCFQTT